MKKGEVFTLGSPENISSFYAHIRDRMYWALGNTEGYVLQVGKKADKNFLECSQFKDMFGALNAFKKSNAEVVTFPKAVLIYFDGKDDYFRLSIKNPAVKQG